VQITGPGRARASRWRLVRAAVAILLTAAVLWQTDFGAVLDALRGPNPAPLVAAVALVILDRALNGWRWVALLGAIDPSHRPSLPRALRVFFVSTFLGTFLPGSVGGDAVRTVATTRLGVPAADAAASVVLDRLLGAIGILLVAVLGLATMPDLAADTVVVAAVAFSSIVAAAGAALVFSRAGAAAAERLIGWMPGRGLRHVGTTLVETVRVHGKNRARMAAVLAASVLVQLLRVLEAWTIGLALGLPVGLEVYFGLVPLILLIILLPVTVNGIGTSQAAFVWLFGRSGVDPADAFALSVLFLALGVVGNLPGAVLYAFPPDIDEAARGVRRG
jgi:uncharacterized protein (TIRG00374 family)